MDFAPTKPYFNTIMIAPHFQKRTNSSGFLYSEKQGYVVKGKSIGELDIDVKIYRGADQLTGSSCILHFN